MLKKLKYKCNAINVEVKWVFVRRGVNVGALRFNDSFIGGFGRKMMSVNDVWAANR